MGTAKRGTPADVAGRSLDRTLDAREDIAAAAHEGRPSRGFLSRYRRALGAGVTLVVLAVVFVGVLPRIADYGAVWHTLQDLTWSEIGALVAVALVNVATFAPPWMASLPGLGYWRALVLSMATTALSNALPGGDAFGAGLAYAMLRTWGFRANAIALAVLANGLWNQLVNVAFPVVALALLAQSGERHPALETAALIGLLALAGAIVALWLVLRGDEGARRIGHLAARVAGPVLRVLRRPPPGDWGEVLVSFRREGVELFRRRWLALTVATVVGHLTVFVTLFVSLRVVGVGASQVSFAEAFAAWTLIRLLTAVPITPAGVGIVELGLTGALVAFGGPQVQVVAAILLYRVLTVVPPIAFGAVAAAAWTRRHASRPAT